MKTHCTLHQISDENTFFNILPSVNDLGVGVTACASDKYESRTVLYTSGSHVAFCQFISDMHKKQFESDNPGWEQVWCL